MKITRKTDYESIFAKKLRELLEKHPKTKEATSKTKLANLIGVKQQTVTQWADGSTTPALEHLKPLALYFEISLDELVTGVSFSNEELHIETGLSNFAIEKLKQLKTNSDIRNKIITEFLNLIIESIDSPVYSSAELAQRSMDYIIGAHDHILRQEEIQNKISKGYDMIYFIDRLNMKNDELDFRTYQLTKNFEYFIIHLTKNTTIKERVKKIFEEGNLNLPDYKDRHVDELLVQFAMGSIINEVQGVSNVLEKNKESENFNHSN